MRCLKAILIAGCFLTPTLSSAEKLRFGGFVTVNYAISDSDNSYQRFIDSDGSLKAGSVAGLQADFEINPQLKGAVQATVSAKNDSDSGADVQLKWAFLRWQPVNNWVLSAGRMRAGIYADSKNLEVGATYAPVFLPAEVYFNEQYIRYDGLNATYKRQVSDDTEWSFEVFGGVNNDTTLRAFNQVANRALFFDTEQRTRGIRVARLQDQNLWFASYIDIDILDANKPRAFELQAKAFTTGVQWHFDKNVMLSAEILHIKSKVKGSANDSNSTGVGSTLSRRYGAFTPFVGYGYTEASRNSAGQKPSQQSAKFGTAYDYSASTRLKLEVGHVDVGDRSGLVDGNFSNRALTYLAVSYNLIY